MTKTRLTAKQLRALARSEYQSFLGFINRKTLSSLVRHGLLERKFEGLGLYPSYLITPAGKQALKDNTK